jgi:hypothetical protein
MAWHLFRKQDGLSSILRSGSFILFLFPFVSHAKNPPFKERIPFDLICDDPDCKTVTAVAKPAWSANPEAPEEEHHSHSRRLQMARKHSHKVSLVDSISTVATITT